MSKTSDARVRQKSDPTNTRDHIITCSARLFRANGYAAVSLRAVAQEAGQTTGSIYHHFASKEDLVTALFEASYKQILAEVKESVEQAAMKGNARSVLRAALTAHLRCLLARDSLPAANIRIFAHVPQSVRDATMLERKAYERFWTGLITEIAYDAGLDQGMTPRSFVMIMFGAMNWTLEWFRPGRDQIDNIADDIMTLLIRSE